MPAGQESRSRGDGGGLGYASPGYYYLSAALQAVRRRKTSDRLLAGVMFLFLPIGGVCTPFL